MKHHGMLMESFGSIVSVQVAECIFTALENLFSDATWNTSRPAVWEIEHDYVDCDLIHIQIAMILLYDNCASCVFYFII